MTVSNPASDPSALPQPRPAPNPPAAPDQKDLWRAYDLAQRHYEVDLQLFSARMNLFLFIQSALVALVAGATQIGRVHLAASRGAVASFGLALAVGWLLVASSSYLWVKTWRAHMMNMQRSSVRAFASTCPADCSTTAHGSWHTSVPIVASTPSGTSSNPSPGSFGQRLSFAASPSSSSGGGFTWAGSPEPSTQHR